MFKLYNIYKTLIKESVMRNQIIDAIERKQRVKITYRSDDKKRESYTGERYIEVYTYGIKNKGGNNSTGGYEAIRAFQLSGDTSSVKPMWKFFKVDNILSWEPVNSYFKTSIEHRDANHVDPRTGDPIRVNHDGDNHMSVIHAQVSFDDEHIDSYKDRKKKEWRSRIDQMVYNNHRNDVEQRRQQAQKDQEEMERRAQQTRDIQQQQMQQQQYDNQHMLANNNDYEEEDIEDDESNTK